MSLQSRTVLLISASIGSGHSQAARAIQTAWKSRFPGDSVTIADFMDERNSYFNYLVKEAYLKMIALAPLFYDMLYRWSQGTRPESGTQRVFGWFMKKTMRSLLCQYQPDIVICTHPFACGALACLKHRKETNVPLVGVITDFAIHQTWVYPEVDAYLVADQALRDELISHHIDAGSVAVTGIPIDPAFALPPAGTRQEPHSDLPSILIMGGGLGLGPVKEILLSLEHLTFPVRTVVITGNNHELRQELSLLAGESEHEVTILGYTSHIRELMADTDLLITKPGALTISEALTSGVPMLFCEPLPGHEVENAKFLIKRGAADWFRISDLDSVTALLSDTARRSRQLTQAGQLARPQSSWAAVDVINNLMAPSRAVGM